MYNSTVVYIFYWKSPLCLRSHNLFMYSWNRNTLYILWNILSQKNEWPFYLLSLIFIDLQRIVPYLNISTFMKYLILVLLKILWFINIYLLFIRVLKKLFDTSKTRITFTQRGTDGEQIPVLASAFTSSHSKLLLQLNDTISLLLSYKMKFYIFQNFWSVVLL